MSKPVRDSLKSRFDALHAERERTWEPAKLARNVDQRRALVAAFDPASGLQPGDAVGPFTLDLSTGGQVSRDELLATGPVLLIFYRFSGCPACNIALPYYDRLLGGALRAAGVRIVAVSPHLPARGLDDIRTRHGLGLTVAGDRGNALGRTFGLTFEPGDSPVPVNDDNWIGALTGTGTHELPQPAAILIDRDGIVRFVDVSPDWLDRTEAEPILAAVAALVPVPVPVPVAA
ncbi:MAG: peroxiredoxin-like family protein [Janthinobacterium lividum]